MRALSIQQPWAWLIVNGYKDCENRSWATNVRGAFAVHAGKKFDAEGYEWVQDFRPDIEMPEPAAFQFGGIVGSAVITDCITEPEGQEAEWFSGPFGFVLDEGQPSEFVPLRGQLGFFAVPDDSVRPLGERVAPSEAKP